MQNLLCDNLIFDLFFCFPATDTRLCQKPGHVRIARSWEPAHLTGTGSEGFFYRHNKRTERDHKKLPGVVAHQERKKK